MSTVLIIVIVVVVVVVVLGLLLTRLPQARERARVQKRERELEQRREQVVDEHREAAAGRERQAEVAEQRARVAEQEAERQRAEARVAEEKAKLHERGLADHELIDDSERDRFAGTSAVDAPGDEGRAADPGAVPGDRSEQVGSDSASATAPAGGRGEELAPGEDLQRPRTSAYEEGQAAADDPSRVEDFEAGRRRPEGR